MIAQQSISDQALSALLPDDYVLCFDSRSASRYKLVYIERIQKVTHDLRLMTLRRAADADPNASAGP